MQEAPFLFPGDVPGKPLTELKKFRRSVQREPGTLSRPLAACTCHSGSAAARSVPLASAASHCACGDAYPMLTRKKKGLGEIS